MMSLPTEWVIYILMKNILTFPATVPKSEGYFCLFKFVFIPSVTLVSLP